MTADILNDYLSSAHMTLMLCRAHADQFELNDEEFGDAAWKIEVSITELEDLRKAIISGHSFPCGDRQKVNNILQLPVGIFPKLLSS